METRDRIRRTTARIALLVALLVASTAHAQPVTIGWRPPAGCSDGDAILWSTSLARWVCGTAGGGTFDTAGAGLTATGSTLDVGCGANMTCAADSVALSTTVNDLDYLETREFNLNPIQQWYLDSGVNLTAGQIDNWAPTGLQTNSVIVVRGADNEGTRITGIDATNINAGDIRYFINLPTGATLPTDASSITFINDSSSSLAANRIQLTGADECRFPVYAVIPMLYGGLDKDGNNRWHVIGDCGWTARSKTQALNFYPNCETASISGTVNDWAPTCNTTYTSSGQGLAGGDLSFQDYSLIRVFVDSGGASITGIGSVTGGNSDPPSLGQTKMLVNYGPGTLTLKFSAAGSAVEHRLLTPNGQDLVLRQYESAILVSPMGDPNPSSQWRVLAVGASNENFPSITTAGATTLGGLLALNSIETPSSLASGVTDDYDPGSREIVWRLTADSAGSQLTGIVAPALGKAEAHLVINLGSGPLALVNDDGLASTSGNRFTLDAPATVIPAQAQRWIWYDTTSARWRVASTGADGRWSLPHALTAASIAGTQNNYAPTNCKYSTVVKLTQSGDVTLTGLSCGQAAGDVKVIIAGAANTLSLASLDTGSSVGNRFRTPRGLTMTVGASGSVMVRYNATDQVWEVIGTTGSATQVTYSSATVNSAVGFTSTTGTVAPIAITDNGSALNIGSGRTTTMAGVTVFGSSATATTALFAIQNPAFTNRLVPAALTSGSSTNNWAPTNWATFEHIIITTSSSTLATLTGASSGNNGQLKTLCNYGPGPLKITNEDTNSTAANRFWLSGGVDTTLQDGVTGKTPCILFRYDASDTRWEELARNFAGTNLGAPSAGTCGTGPTFSTNSTNEAFTITTGTGATACTITFGDSGYTNAPTCTVSAQSGTQPAYSISTTALTMSTAAASATYDVICRGH